MSRRFKKIKNRIFSDYRYRNIIIGKFINIIMKDGKKQKAEKIVYQALNIIKKTLRKDPVIIFKNALYNICPILEVKTRRIGGTTYQVPIEIKKK